ncbi:MAG TPA: FecR domain-containing protein [Candidatus Sulfotelmatobacter sp.]|nr:FecR domain-containing protein [Candidatus Sulfotelmatobacter sp.]
MTCLRLAAITIFINPGWESIGKVHGLHTRTHKFGKETATWSGSTRESKGRTMKTFLVILASLLLATSLSLPAWSQDQNSPTAYPGSINYVDGQGTIGTESVTPKSVGTVQLAKGQSLTTQAGKVEILLTPGVFLRLDDNSSVKMISPDLANTEVELNKGRAMVEVLDISKNNDIRIAQNDASTTLLKRGLYDFDADHEQVRVFKGEAEVHANDRIIKVKGYHEVTLNDGARPQSAVLRYAYL